MQVRFAGSFAQWQQNFPYMWIEPGVSSLTRESTFFEVSLWQTSFFLVTFHAAEHFVSVLRWMWTQTDVATVVRLLFTVNIMSKEITWKKQAFYQLIHQNIWVTHTHKRWFVSSSGKWDNLKFLHGSQSTAPLADHAFALLNNNRNRKKTWSWIPPQPTLFRQSSPFAFASTSTSITTESGRVTWQSILAVSSSKIFGVPLFQKTINNKKRKQFSSSLLEKNQTPYIKPSSLSQTLPLRVADLRATSCSYINEMPCTDPPTRSRPMTAGFT